MMRRPLAPAGTVNLRVASDAFTSAQSELQADSSPCPPEVRTEMTEPAASVSTTKRAFDSSGIMLRRTADSSVLMTGPPAPSPLATSAARRSAFMIATMRLAGSMGASSPPAGSPLAAGGTSPLPDDDVLPVEPDGRRAGAARRREGPAALIRSRRGRLRGQHLTGRRVRRAVHHPGRMRLGGRAGDHVVPRGGRLRSGLHRVGRGRRSRVVRVGHLGDVVQLRRQRFRHDHGLRQRREREHDAHVQGDGEHEVPAHGRELGTTGPRRPLPIVGGSFTGRSEDAPI